MNVGLRKGSEFDIVRRMLVRWGDIADGIGDDAAVLELTSKGSLVVSTDASIENVHFRREWLSPQEIGYRATAAALSDLAAMAATPVGMLLALTIPRSWQNDIDSLADGIGEAARRNEAKIVGGDLSEGDDLAIVATVLGQAKRPLLRSTARAGDRVYVTGELGGPGATLAALLKKREILPMHREKFAHPFPRIREARWLAAHGANAAIDISDGLAADLANVAAASGVDISIELECVPATEGVSARDACSSGEEYELVVTSSGSLDAAEFQREFGIPLTEIGTVEAGAPDVRVLDHGTRVPTPEGYLHFRR